ncbi:uncharacterized protein LOC118439103 [Folsomia candida]|uniref:uncharacterized protein LOC118439103 n=1 Tax=Folsomia candida TaxID=158441 RepID=UPI00160551AA|nr:uncharacterized protein LOC118439103 [Folsomia candida]
MEVKKKDTEKYASIIITVILVLIFGQMALLAYENAGSQIKKVTETLAEKEKDVYKLYCYVGKFFFWILSAIFVLVGSILLEIWGTRVTIDFLSGENISPPLKVVQENLVPEHPAENEATTNSNSRLEELKLKIGTLEELIAKFKRQDESQEVERDCVDGNMRFTPTEGTRGLKISQELRACAFVPWHERDIVSWVK